MLEIIFVVVRTQFFIYVIVTLNEYVNLHEKNMFFGIKIILFLCNQMNLRCFILKY